MQDWAQNKQKLSEGNGIHRFLTGYQDQWTAETEGDQTKPPAHTGFPAVHKENNQTHACASFCLYLIYITRRNSRHELLKELAAISNKKQV